MILARAAWKSGKDLPFYGSFFPRYWLFGDIQNEIFEINRYLNDGEIQWTGKWSEHDVDLSINNVEDDAINTNDYQRYLWSQVNTTLL